MVVEISSMVAEISTEVCTSRCTLPVDISMYNKSACESLSYRILSAKMIYYAGALQHRFDLTVTVDNGFWLVPLYPYLN